jgi:hypothetical protein
MSTSEILQSCAVVGTLMFAIARMGVFGHSIFVVGPKDRIISVQNMIVYERVVYRVDGEEKDSSFWSFAPIAPIRTRN